MPAPQSTIIRDYPTIQQSFRLMVIIPALNEEATIQQVIASIPKQIPTIETIEIVVIDDGSTDNTAELARDAGAYVISHSRNRGVGAAIQTGLAEAVRRNVDIAVNVDADGQFNPGDIGKLVKPLLDEQADFVTASRFKDPALTPHMPRIKIAGNSFMSWLVSILTSQKFYDVSCGFRAYSREAMYRLALRGQFTYTQETFMILAFKGIRILEIPIEVRGMREHGQSKVAANLWVYGVRTANIIFNCFRDYRPELFFNIIALIAFIISLALGSFFLGHRLVTGSFSPHIWSGFVAAFFFGIGLVVLIVGQLASMINRVRSLQEEQLYLARLQFHQPRD
jgi:glycosyltransferase involved in cell wall biosynthesis